MLWCTLWFVIVRDDPRDQKCIKPKEINRIESSRTNTVISQKAPPYLKILANPAVWTCMLCDLANGWGLFTILTEGPNFISNVLHQDIEDVSIVLYKFS